MSLEHYQIRLSARSRGIYLITDEIIDALPSLPSVGMLHLFIRHTSAGITINENADPTVRQDIESWLDLIAPENAPYYMHTIEGPDDMPAHIKAMITGHSVQIPIMAGKLGLGTWQGIYLCEFRNAQHSRELIATIHSSEPILRI